MSQDMQLASKLRAKLYLALVVLQAVILSMEDGYLQQHSSINAFTERYVTFCNNFVWLRNGSAADANDPRLAASCIPMPYPAGRGYPQVASDGCMSCMCVLTMYCMMSMASRMTGNISPL